MVQKAAEQWPELLAHSSEKSMSRVPPRWWCVVSTAASCKEGKASAQASFLWTFSPSGLLCSHSCLLLLPTPWISQAIPDRNAFDGTASSAVLEGGPGVPWSHPGCLELI